MNILEFLNSNGIIVGEENFPKENRKNNILDVDNQISLIIEVHKILEGKKNNIIPRIESSIGRDLESFIVQSKRTSKVIKFFEEKTEKSDFDFFIIEEGKKILKKANKALSILNEDEYLKIIMRSMNKYEVCLGRVDEGSLKKKGLEINIRTIRYISYNMIEHDCYSYIKRIKKRDFSGNILEVIRDFVYKSNLNKESIDYIRMLANFPIESVKTLLKMKENRSKFSDEEWVREINISQKIDGIELL